MERFKDHPISSALGLIFIAIAFTLLFVETLYNIPLWGIAILIVSGILLLFAKDRFIDILTLGFSRFIKDVSSVMKKKEEE